MNLHDPMNPTTIHDLPAAWRADPKANAEGCARQLEAMLASMQVPAEIRTPDHPAANGRKPQFGEQEYVFGFVAEDGRPFAVRMGAEGWRNHSQHVLDMLTEAPSYNDCSLETRNALASQLAKVTAERDEALEMLSSMPVPSGKLHNPSGVTIAELGPEHRLLTEAEFMDHRTDWAEALPKLEFWLNYGRKWLRRTKVTKPSVKLASRTTYRVPIVTICGQSTPSADNLRTRQTPRTDAVMQDPFRDGNDLPELARTLETENSELRRERDKVRAELAAMREAIKEAHAALKASSDCWPVWSGTPSTFAAHQKQIAALAKLQPFIGAAPAPATEGGAA